MSDFRSDPMPSAEGQGRARQAWAAYQSATNKLLGPTVDKVARPIVRKYAVGQVSDLIGFWAVWHLEGGFEGLQRLGMSRASIFRKVAAFRRFFHVHPDEFEMPGVTLDIAKYQESITTREDPSNS